VKNYITTNTEQGHLTVTAVLGTKAANIDLDHHHQSSMGEAEGQDLQMKDATMKTTKKKWGHHALLVEFASLQSPRDSSYLMINKNMTDHRNHNHGLQITCKQSKY
jgi:hypothetical protein